MRRQVNVRTPQPANLNDMDISFDASPAVPSAIKAQRGHGAASSSRDR
jgi:hypothetical protein